MPNGLLRPHSHIQQPHLRQVNATIRLQNAALFCLSALGLPQASADLQEKGVGDNTVERQPCLLNPFAENEFLADMFLSD